MTDYDQFAKDFAATRDRAWPEFDVFFPLIKKSDRVLDMGCGNGRLRKFLPTNLVREGDYFGFDLSQNLLDIARKNFPKDAFFKGDFGNSLPFGADNFDWVISIAAFHHLLDKPSQQQCLREVHRVLKPGGQVFFTTWVLPQKYYWRNFWQGRTFSKNWLIPFGKDKHPRIYRYVTHDDLARLLKKVGFEIEVSKQFEDRNFVVLARKVK